MLWDPRVSTHYTYPKKENRINNGALAEVQVSDRQFGTGMPTSKRLKAETENHATIFVSKTTSAFNKNSARSFCGLA
jgi:hypothetical protein